MFIIRTTRREHTQGQAAAMMLAMDTDPYGFMSTMDYKKPKGIKVIAATEAKPARMEMSISDPKQMCALVRVMSSKSELPDADESED